MTNRLTICATCTGLEGPALARAVGAVDGWDVVLHDCLSMCAEPTAMAVQGGGAVYLFSGVMPADAADIRAFMALYEADALVPDARPAGRLRFCLKGRVPE